MRVTNQILLASEGISTRKGRTLMLSFGVSVGTAALVFLVSLIFGTKALITRQLGAVQENLLVVKQDPERPWSVLREPAYQEMLDFSRATPAIKAVYRELPVQPLPMLVVAENVRFAGPPIHGIEENLFRENVEHLVRGFRYGPVKPITDEGNLLFDDEESEDTPYVPVMLPTIAGNLFDIFGSQDPSVERFRRTVDISNENKPGAPFYIVLKKKGNDGDPDSIRAYRCRVVGYSNLLPPPLTIAVPFEYAQEWNEFSGTSPDYDRFILDVVDLEAARIHAQEAGFMTEANPGQEISMMASRGAFYLFAIAVAFCLIIALVAAIGIFNGLSISVVEQSRRVGILRSVGAARRDIVVIFLFEAIFIGVLGGIIGLIVSHLIMWGCNIGVKEYIEDVTGFVIDTLFIRDLVPALIISLGAFGLSLVSSLLSGVVPAYRASRLDPAVVLREG